MGIDVEGAKNWIIGGLGTLIMSSPGGQLYNHLTGNNAQTPPPQTPQPTVLSSGPAVRQEPTIEGSKDLVECTQGLAKAGVDPDKAAKTCLTSIQENNGTLMKMQAPKRTFPPSGM